MATQNITIPQGSRFSMLVDLAKKSPAGIVTPWDLTNLAIRAELRTTFDAATAVEFNTEIVDAVQGRVRLTLGATDTEAMKRTTYVYDLEVYDPVDPDYVYRPLSGNAIVTPEVTRG